MTVAAAVLARAHAAGLAVEAVGGRLRWRGDSPPGDLLADLRQHKTDLLALLTTAPRYTVTVPCAAERQKTDASPPNLAGSPICGPLADPLPAEMPLPAEGGAP